MSKYEQQTFECAKTAACKRFKSTITSDRDLNIPVQLSSGGVIKDSGNLRSVILMDLQNREMKSDKK